MKRLFLILTLALGIGAQAQIPALAFMGFGGLV